MAAGVADVGEPPDDLAGGHEARLPPEKKRCTRPNTPGRTWQRPWRRGSRSPRPGIPRGSCFLDERGGRTDLVRRYWRGQRGERVVDHAPDSRWHTTTFLAALRVTGLTAPAVFDGPIDGVSFLAYIEHVLAPTLRPGDVVVLDNLSVHRSPAVRAAVETVGATRCFLPKYSPDLNPIELCFAKLQTILRAVRCRAREERWATIGACVPRFAPTECRNYFRHCGYSGATRS